MSQTTTWELSRRPRDRLPPISLSCPTVWQWIVAWLSGRIWRARRSRRLWRRTRAWDRPQGTGRDTRPSRENRGVPWSQMPPLVSLSRGGSRRARWSRSSSISKLETSCARARRVCILSCPHLTRTTSWTSCRPALASRMTQGRRRSLWGAWPDPSSVNLSGMKESPSLTNSWKLTNYNNWILSKC